MAGDRKTSARMLSSNEDDDDEGMGAAKRMTESPRKDLKRFILFGPDIPTPPQFLLRNLSASSTKYEEKGTIVNPFYLNRTQNSAGDHRDLR